MRDAKKSGGVLLTFDAVPDLHQNGFLGVLDHERSVHMPILLPDREEMLSLHVSHLLALRPRPFAALDLDDGCAAEGLDCEGVTAEREGLFLEYNRFWLLREESREDTDGMGGGC